MTFVSYAQNYEDVLLWRALRDVEKGSYIDIGAQDPVVDSVSLAFYEAGWRGIHVEPTAAYAERLRAARPDEVVIEAAVTDAAGPIRFFELGGLSSGKEEIAKHHRKSGHKPREIRVPTVRLDNLLGMADGDVHWMKIDVEGMEADVLRSWGSSPRRPWILVIESTFPNTERPTEHLWIEEVLSRGYSEVFFDGLSRYFVHETHAELSGRLNRPANVFDQYQVTPNHFAAALTRQEMAAAESRETALKDELQQALERVVALEMQLADAAARHEEVLGQLSTEQSSLAELQARHAEASGEIDRLTGQWKSEREARASIDAELLKIAELVGNERQQSSGGADGLRSVAPGTTYAALKARLAHASEELDRARDHAVAQYAAGQSSRDPEIRLLDERIASLQDDVAEARVRIAEVETNRRDAEGRAARAERDNARLQSKVDDQAAALASVRMEANGLALRLAAAQEQIAAVYGSRTGRIASWLNLLPPMRKYPKDAASVGLAALQQPPHQSAPAAQGHAMEIAVNDIRHTSNLLALNGSVFVDALYRTFLKRSADRAGRDHFIGRLQAGHSKEAVLLAIATSPEARAIGAPVEGLAELEKRHRQGRGGFFASRNMRALEAKLNQLEYSLGESQNALVDRLDRIETSLDQVRSTIGSRGGLRADVSGHARSDDGRSRASIKRGISIDPPASAAEFIDGLRREVQLSAEAVGLARN